MKTYGNNQIIVFDPDGGDGFITVIKNLAGYLLSFTMTDGSIVDGIVKNGEHEFFDEITVELWQEERYEGEPVYQTIDLSKVQEVYYY